MNTLQKTNNVLPDGMSWNIARKVGQKKRAKVVEMDVAKIQPTIPTETSTENIKLLQWAERCYDALDDARRRRKRVRKYVRGDQWHELIPNPDNPAENITEEAWIRSQGRVPLKQNILSSIKNNLVGRFRDGQMKPIIIARDKDRSQETEMLSNALRAAHELNHIKELDSRTFEEFLISGAPIQKIGYKYWKTRDLEDAFVHNVNFNRIFFNSDVADLRLHDLRIVGEIIDLPIDELLSVFAKNKADEKYIREWYSGFGSDIDGIAPNYALSTNSVDNLNFYMPAETNKCRLIETWYLKSEWRTFIHDYLTGEYIISTRTLDEIEQINAQRIQQAVAAGVPIEEVPLMDAERKYENFWYVKFLTPWGHCLYEGETPYLHQDHPYVFILHPLIDGEVYGMFDEFIDNQRYINRLINMSDMILGASAKGVLLVPEEAIPDDMDLSDFSDEWSKFNGVIKIKMKQGYHLPQQLTSNSANPGISDMLQVQMKLLQEISGVNYAIQGQSAKSGTPASLYAQEAANSAINSKDIMDSFTFFIKRRDFKLLKVIHQFYNEKRMLAVAGDYYAEEAKEYDPEKVQDLDFDVDISQTIDTPSFRQITDDFMLRLLEGQLIDLETYLENSSMPFAKQLLSTVQQKREEMEKSGMAGQGQLPPELMQQAQIDPSVNNMMGKMLQKPQG